MNEIRGKGVVEKLEEDCEKEEEYMSYKTRLRNLCKTCKYAVKHYKDTKRVTTIWCVKRNGTLNKQPKKCDEYSQKEM